MNDTPRTNDIIEQIKGFRTSSAIYSLEQFSRLLERELTVVTEQRDVAIKCHKWCYEDRKRIIEELTAAREELAELKTEYGTWWAQKRIAIDELKEVTEQRDEARKLAERYRNLSCDSQEEADEKLLPWETTNPNEP